MEETRTPLEDFTARFHQLAAAGDAQKLEPFLKGNFNVDVTNDKGWTALMFGARNGHSEVVKLLTDKGCDVTKLNSMGQTALDIAKFWSHSDVVHILEQNTSTINQHKYSGLPNQGMQNYFGHNPIDRANHRRKDKDWLQRVMIKPTTKWCLFSHLNPYVIGTPDHSTTKPTISTSKLLTVSYEDIESFMKSQNPLTLFLGLEHTKDSSEVDRSTDECALAWFAVDVSEMDEEAVLKINPAAQCTLPIPRLMLLDNKHAGIMAQARSVFAWHERYTNCPTCGGQTSVEDAGYKRTCLDSACCSLQGIHNTSYPRVDPTVIMAVISPDMKRILFGRSQRHPTKMWSCLAGFMEPGESIEDAVRRETLEESGIRVGRVEYHSSQPWPMPCSLMIGCVAMAITEDIHMDPEELSDCRWFERKEAVQMITRTHPEGLYCPPDQAIAHQLIKSWLHMTSNL